MQIGTDQLKGYKIPVLRQMYREARAAALAAAGQGAYEKVGGFDAFASSFIREDDGDSQIQHARRFVIFALGQLNLKMGQTTFSPPSPETEQGGGFLGGEHHFRESESAQRLIADILARRPV